MPKQILILTNLYGAGGVETHLLNLCSLLVELGAEITLASRIAHPSVPLVQHHRDIPVRLVTTPFAGNPHRLRVSNVWARAVWPLRLWRHKFDVLYTFEVSGFIRFLTPFVAPDGYILWNRIGPPSTTCETVSISVKDALDGLITETGLQAEALQKAHDLDIPTAIIPHLGHTKAPPRRGKEIANGQLRIAYLGRFQKNKGVHRLIDIWPNLGIGPARLDFYGYGWERDPLEESIRWQGLQDSVQVNGGWDDAVELAEILNQTDLVVLPSETEGLPVVLLESMAHGVPFVATDVGAVRTLAEDNPDVRVVPLDNGALKEAIQEMAHAIRAGDVRGDRLQAYHQARYGYETLSRQWVEALLYPERFWTNENAVRKPD